MAGDYFQSIEAKVFTYVRCPINARTIFHHLITMPQHAGQPIKCLTMSR